MRAKSTKPALLGARDLGLTPDTPQNAAADQSPTATLFASARAAFSGAHNLGMAFYEAMADFADAPWEKYQPTFAAIWSELVTLQCVMQSPPSGWDPLAACLKKLAGVMSRLRDCVESRGISDRSPRDGTPPLYPWANYATELTEVGNEGLQVVWQVQKATRPDHFEIDANRERLAEILPRQFPAAAIDEIPNVQQISAAAPQTKKKQKFAWLAEAMLLVREHPDWLDAEIAREVGRDPSALSRCPEYKLAAAMARGSKTDLPKGHITIDTDSGRRDVEAVALAPSSTDVRSDRGQLISGSRYYREYCAECGDAIKVSRDKVGTNPVCDDCRT